MKFESIAIDGPSGAGKSTVAKALADRLHFEYLDTGAMYRAITWGLLQEQVDVNREGDVKNALPTLEVTVKNHHTYVNGQAVDDYIRTPEITRAVSPVSSYGAVREKMVALQREIAKKSNIILDGRDIGTVVLPNADLKIFLTASPEVRARRRLHDEKNTSRETYQEILENLKKRDDYDSHRKESPLKPAEDSILLESDEMSLREVVDWILQQWEKNHAL